MRCTKHQTEMTPYRGKINNHAGNGKYEEK